MRPFSATKYRGNLAFADMKQVGKFNASSALTVGRKLFDEIHLMVGKLGQWVFFSGRACVPSAVFLNHIPNVVIVSSKEKMIRANTCAIVAFVASKFSFWYRAIMKLPRITMRSYLWAIFTRTQQAITIVFEDSCAHPTVTKFWSNNWAIFVNALPESYREIGHTITAGVIAFTIAIFSNGSILRSENALTV